MSMFKVLLSYSENGDHYGKVQSLFQVFFLFFFWKTTQDFQDFFLFLKISKSSHVPFFFQKCIVEKCMDVNRLVIEIRSK